jgi:hypothetical protein
MIIHNAAITGSLTLNGIDISDITGSEAGVGALNAFSSSILSYTASNDAKLTALNAQTASILSYTSSNDAKISAIYTATSSLNASVSSLNAQSASLLAYTSSNDARVSALNSFSSSILSYTSSTDAKIASIYTTTASLNASVSSLNTYTSSLNAKTASFATTGSNTFTGRQYISDASQASNFISTASFYTDGGARITKDMYVSGTAYFNNITVFGTQSVSYISSSQLNIGTNIISVNTDTPSIRFGGLAVYDSGSTGLTGSILWDSQNNHWVYSNPSGSSYSGGMFISGPRSAALGSEQGTTLNSLMKGQGGDHMTSSAVFDVSGSVGIGTSSPAYTLDVQGIYGQSTTSTQPFVIYGDSGDTNGLFRIQMDSISDSFGTGARTFLGDGGIDLFLGTANSSYTPNNTYIALNHSGEISMGAGAATKHLVINTNGNVGIGTTSPTTTLHVRTDTGVLIKGSSSDSDAILSFLPASGGRQYNFRNYGSSFGIQDASADNIRMYFHFNGNVGIGDSGPSSRLHVYTNGTGSSYNGIGIDNGAQEHYWYLEDNFTSVYNIGSTSGKWKWSNSNGTHVTILSGGSVGIGTTSPGYSLQVGNTGAGYNMAIIGSATAGIEIRTSTAGGRIAALEQYFSNEGSLWLYDSNTTKVLFRASGSSYINPTVGNVGIGTTDPSYKLDVSGTTRTTGNTVLASGGTYVSIGGAPFYAGTSVGSLSIKGDLYPGIAFYTGSGGLDQVGQIFSYAGTGNMILAADPRGVMSSTTMQFEIDGGTKMLINSSGNVGIGTTNPVSLLHVQAANNVVGTILVKGGKGDVTGVGEINSKLDFGSNDTSVNNDDNIGGRIASVTEYSNGAFTGLAFSTFQQGRSPDLKEAVRITNTGNVGIGTTDPGEKLVVSGGSIEVRGTTYPSLGLYTTSGTNWGITNRYTGNRLSIDVIGTGEVVNILSNGNVGIGTTSPSRLLHILAATGNHAYQRIEGGLGGYGGFLELMANSGGSGTDSAGKVDFYMTSTNRIATIAAQRSSGGANYGTLTFSTADNATTPTERMRISSEGYVYINATSNPLPDNAQPQFAITGGSGTDAVAIKHTQNANNTLNIWQTGTTQHNAIAFYKGDTQTNRGNIVVTTSGTSYNTVSDYRLKENVTPLENGLDRLMQLKPSKFNWIENGTESEGFIAHELQEYFPDAVSGEKDAVYSSTGNIKAQSVDYGRITPLLVKAIQELKQQNDELKAEIDILKNK